jgi:parallel beta-helix repeat protein
MTVKRFLKILLPFLLVGTIGLFTIAQYITQWSNQSRDYYNGEIVIKNDNDFTERYNFPGSGTSDDPYQIKDLVIETTKMWAIAVFDTTKYFTIENCTLAAFHGCIYLNSIAQRTALVENNNCTLYSGYYYWYYYNIPESCISVINSVGIMIRENLCFGYDYWGNGISLWNSDYTIITNNTGTGFEASIKVVTSSNVIIERNICKNNIYGNGLSITSSSDIYILNNVVRNNTYQGIGLQESNYNIVIINNTIVENQVGIFVNENYYYPFPEHWFNVISGNNFENNSNSAIILYDMTNLDISSNYIKNHKLGITIYDAWNCSIYNNRIESSTEYGIQLIDGYNVTIYENNFINNNLGGTDSGTAQALDESEASDLNFWYNQISSRGNFWSDLIWNEYVVYEIDGIREITDLYPLESPVTL